MRNKGLAYVTIAAIAGTAVFAGGHAGNPAVSARNAHMSLYSFNLGLLGDMAKGTTEYDAAKATEAANNLAAVAAMPQQLTYWVDGTAQGEVDGSRSKPEIWTDWDGFAARMKQMEDGAAQLASVAGNGLEALQGGIGAAGAACGDCHKAYRGPRN